MKTLRGNPFNIMAHVLVHDILIKFKRHLYCYIDFQSNTWGKNMKFLILSVMG